MDILKLNAYAIILLRAGMKILITGGAGFIGSRLSEKLLFNKNNKVYIIDNFDPFYPKSDKLKNISEIKKLKNFKLYETDIVNKTKLGSILHRIKPDVIIHLAAKAGVRNSIEDPIAYFKTNIEGTMNLLEIAKDLKIKNFVFGSSSSVYGERSKVPFNETDNIDYPISPYGLTKVSGEKMCKIYSSYYGMNITCLRFFTVYGPRQRPDLAIHKFINNIENGKEITLFGDGNTFRDYTYVDDIVEGIAKCISNRHRFEVFNLGNSKPIKLKELIKHLEKALGKKAIIKWMPDQPGDVSKTYADIKKAKKVLKWQPKTDFAQGIAKMVEWYRKR